VSDVKTKTNVEDRIGWAQESTLFVVHYPARLPLGIRIQAAHMLVELNRMSKSKEEELLLNTWIWCHQLVSTKFMVEWKNKTMALWSQRVGDLAKLPDLEVKPPTSGYGMVTYILER
jgi:hypothetical protein